MHSPKGGVVLSLIIATLLLLLLTNIILNLLIRNFWSTFVQIIVQNINGVLMAHLKLDTRETDIMFVDKANKHYAEKNDVIKFILAADKGDTKRFKVASFVGKSHGLSKTKLAVYCVAATYYDEYPFSVASLINTYKRTYGVKGRDGSWYTAIYNLVDEGIFVKDKDNKYILTPWYRIPKNCETAKFMIVELDEDETSLPITI